MIYVKSDLLSYVMFVMTRNMYAILCQMLDFLSDVVLDVISDVI